MSGTVLSAAPITAYKDNGGQYQSVGKLGAAIIGNSSTHDFKILLYITKDKQITHAQITPFFQFSFPRQRYASFHDINRQGWLLLFESDSGLLEFSRYVCVARYFASTTNCLITMDLMIGEGPALGAGDLFELRYTAWALKGTNLGDHFDSNVGLESLDYKPARMRLGAGKLIRGWEQGLPGLAKGGRRLLVLPPQLAYGDKGVVGGKVAPNSVVLYDVELTWMRSAVVTAPVPAPRERQSVAADFLPYLPEPAEFEDENNGLPGYGKDRSNSFSKRAMDNEMATTSGTKLHILSRMAKMGQSVLPNCNFAEQHFSHAMSDALASIDDVQIVPSTCISVPPHVVRQPKPTRPAADLTLPSLSAVDYSPPTYQHSVSYPPQPPSSHPVAFYNNQLALFNQPSTCETNFLTHTTMSHIESHNESNHSNMEAQMAVMNKLGDKVERMLERVESNCALVPPMESRQLLTNLQRIIEENERLKNECSEKNVKIGELLRQNQSLLEQRDDVIFTLEQEKLQLARKLGESTAEQSDLQLKFGRLNAARDCEMRLKMEATDEVLKLRLYVQELEQRNESLGQMLFNKEKSCAAENRNRTSCCSMIDQLGELQRPSSELVDWLFVEQTIDTFRKRLAEDGYKDDEQQLPGNKVEERLKLLLAEEQERCQRRLACERNYVVESLRDAVNDRESLVKRSQEEVQDVQAKNCVLREQVNTLNIRMLELIREHKHAEERSLMLENKLDAVIDKNQSFSTEVKKVMNMVFQTLRAKIDQDVLYQGAHIITLLLQVIKSVTLEVLDAKDNDENASTSDRATTSRFKIGIKEGAPLTSGLETACVENKLYMMTLVGDPCPVALQMDSTDDAAAAPANDVLPTDLVETVYFSPAFEASLRKCSQSQLKQMAEKELISSTTEANYDGLPYCNANKEKTSVEEVPVLGNRLEFIVSNDQITGTPEVLPSLLVQPINSSDTVDDDDDDVYEGEYEEVAAPLPEFLKPTLSSNDTNALLNRINGPMYADENDASYEFGTKYNDIKPALSPLIDEDEDLA